MKNLKKLNLVILTALFMAFLSPSFLPALQNASTASAAVTIGKKTVSAKIPQNQKITLKLSLGQTKIQTNKIKWSSSNKSIATVGKKGVVKGIKPGKATISAKYKNKTYKCRITVIKNEFYNKKFKPKYDDYTEEGIYQRTRKVYYSNKNIIVRAIIYNRTGEEVTFTDGLIISVYTKPFTDSSKKIIAEQSYPKKDSNNGGFGMPAMPGTEEEEDDSITIPAYDYAEVFYTIPSRKVQRYNADLTRLTPDCIRYITY